MNIDIEALEFRFQDKSGSPDTLATMTLMIGQFQVRGFRIMRTQYPENGEDLVLFPPSNRSKGGRSWVKVFWTDDKESWSRLQEIALAEFRQERQGPADPL